MEPSFDAAAYVADLRRFVPLETLSTELEGHLTTLKNRVSRLSLLIGTGLEQSVSSVVMRLIMTLLLWCMSRVPCCATCCPVVASHVPNQVPRRRSVQWSLSSSTRTSPSNITGKR